MRLSLVFGEVPAARPGRAWGVAVESTERAGEPTFWVLDAEGTPRDAAAVWAVPWTGAQFAYEVCPLDGAPLEATEAFRRLAPCGPAAAAAPGVWVVQADAALHDWRPLDGTWGGADSAELGAVLSVIDLRVEAAGAALRGLKLN